MKKNITVYKLTKQSNPITFYDGEVWQYTLTTSDREIYSITEGIMTKTGLKEGDEVCVRYTENVRGNNVWRNIKWVYPLVEDSNDRIIMALENIEERIANMSRPSSVNGAAGQVVDNPML